MKINNIVNDLHGLQHDTNIVSNTTVTDSTEVRCTSNDAGEAHSSPIKDSDNSNARSFGVPCNLDNDHNAASEAVSCPPDNTISTTI